MMRDACELDDRPYQWLTAEWSWVVGRPAVTLDGNFVTRDQYCDPPEKRAILMWHSYTPHLEWVELWRIEPYPVSPIEQP